MRPPPLNRATERPVASWFSLSTIAGSIGLTAVFFAPAIIVRTPWICSWLFGTN